MRPPSPTSLFARLLSAVAVVAITLVPAGPATATNQVSGSDVVSDVLYEVDGAAGLVRVSAVIEVTALDSSVGSFSITLPAEVANFAVTEGGMPLDVRLATEGGGTYKSAEILLDGPLGAASSTTVLANYDIVAGTRNSRSAIRVNPAYVRFGVRAHGNAPGGSVTVRADGYTVDPEKVPLLSVIGGGAPLYRADDIQAPQAFGVTFSAENPAALLSTSVVVGENEVVVRSWPGDEQWASAVVGAIEQAGEMLFDSIGLPWPDGAPITITETVAPTEAGFGGWFNQVTHEIQVGERVDEQLVLHELSHAWFNETLFAERWIGEGLADEFAARIVRERFDSRPFPKVIVRGQRVGKQLNEWAHIGVGSADPLEDRYAYNASWSILFAITNEIGTDGLSRVLAAASRDEIAYRGAGQAEQTSVPDDWRRFLDLLAEAGGSREAADLFYEYVATDTDREVMDTRAASRKSYAKVVAALGGWDLPYPLRTAMESWDFTAANSMIRNLERVALAVDLFEQRFPQANAAGVYGERVANLADSGESIIDDITGVLDMADLLDATSGVTLGPVASLFHSGAGYEQDRAAAQTALEAGDVATADLLVARINDDLDRSREAGQRSLFGVVGFIVFALGGALVRSRLRRRADRAAKALNASVANGDTFGRTNEGDDRAAVPFIMDSTDFDGP
ncbi:MAG: hypothetical protein GXP36_00920 [Actinobacteria bacterium]|nr:hypothetical protein [Actinomycetota bacterium]